MTEERHIIGFETHGKHTARWAKWGGLSGWLFGAFIFIPGSAMSRSEAICSTYS